MVKSFLEPHSKTHGVCDDNATQFWMCKQSQGCLQRG